MERANRDPISQKDGEMGTQHIGSPVHLSGVLAAMHETENRGADLRVCPNAKGEHIGSPVRAEITKQDSVAVVTFKAACISDVEGIAAASGQIKEFIDKNHPNSLIFDFETVKFFSSGVLGLLLDIRAKLETYNGKVVISAINPRLHRVFKITNLDKIFRFFPNKESAVKAMSTD